MLKSYNLYKNPRKKFISLEHNKYEKKCRIYLLTKSGKHTFIGFINVEDKDDYIKRLKLKEATELEQAKVALYRINDTMVLDYNEAYLDI